METPTVCPFAIDITPGSLPKKRLGKTWDWRGFLIFAVQGQAYKVPFPVLQKHLHFFLTLLAKSNRKLSGGPWKEIILPPLCTVSDFDSLLQVMSYLHYTEFSDWERPTVSVEEWVGALHIADQWDIRELHHLATKNLPAALALERTPSYLTLVNRILFARKCNAPGWLAPLYSYLISNWNHPLSITSRPASSILWLGDCRPPRRDRGQGQYSTARESKIGIWLWRPSPCFRPFLWMLWTN
ncbi:hypothetical protein FA13DRAFT_620334 [Coprinellus micaceus]|uniref:BTB domain-containing protein n=1 Tax=Coprinellus micaceus TaxID=71717 RepID=A0A4Y7T6R3_COPMI|nr:hypothetical protein FA13DRAFT_620334 [Coprinellus micaceus]